MAGDAEHPIDGDGLALAWRPGRRGSRLGRLFTYSKDTKFTAQENFTTEALAIAIVDDCTPMLTALLELARREACPFSWVGARALAPATQVYVAGGFLDLVLVVEDAAGGQLGEVWVEVKTGADEHGNQLDGYRADARRVKPTPAWVITLNDAKLKEYVPNLTWLDLYQAARRSPNEHPSWKDFRLFLEEQMIASDAQGTVSDVEAASLGAAFTLLQKVSAVVIAVYRSLPEFFPGAAAKPMIWRSEGELLNSAAALFRKTGAFAGFGGVLWYGLRSEDGCAYWYVAVSAENLPKARVEGMLKAAEGRLDPARWVRSVTPATLLVVRTRAASLTTHSEVLDWFRSQLRELADAGVIAASAETAGAPAGG